jgi:predicted acetyltransferase
VEFIQSSLADLEAGVAREARALLKATFLEDAPGKDDYYAEYGTPALIVVLRDGSQVIGHLAAYERDVSIGSEALRIGMIGGVVIAPGYRGAGHSRALIGHAHAHFEAGKIPFSVLFAYEARVYESSGYKPMQNETRLFDKGAWHTFVFRGSMYAELSERPWPNQLLDLRGGAV